MLKSMTKPVLLAVIAFAMALGALGMGHKVTNVSADSGTVGIGHAVTISTDSGPLCDTNVGLLGHYNDFGQWLFYGPPVQSCYSQPVYQQPVYQQPGNLIYLPLPNGDNCWYRDHDGNPYDNCFGAQYYWNSAANCWARDHNNNPFDNCSYGRGALPYNQQQVHAIGQHGRRY